MLLSNSDLLGSHLFLAFQRFGHYFLSLNLNCRRSSHNLLSTLTVVPVNFKLVRFFYLFLSLNLQFPLLELLLQKPVVLDIITIWLFLDPQLLKAIQRAVSWQFRWNNGRHVQQVKILHLRKW